MINCEEKLLEELLALNTDEKAYLITTDKKGNPNIRITQNSAQKLLHSGYDAEKEGGDFAAKNFKPGRDIAVFGMGLGYHVKAFAEKLAENQILYVFETNLSLLKLAFNFTDIGAVFKKNNVILNAASSFAKLQTRFYECMRNGAAPVLYIGALLTVPSDSALLRRCMENWNVVDLAKNRTEPHLTASAVKSYFNVSPKPRKKKYNITIIESYNMHPIAEGAAKNFALAFSCLGCGVNYMSRQEFYDTLSGNNEGFANILLQSDFYLAFHLGLIHAKEYALMRAPLITVMMDRPYISYTAGTTHKDDVICTWHDRRDLKYAGMYHTKAAHKFLTVPAEINFDANGVFENERPFDTAVINDFTRAWDILYNYPLNGDTTLSEKNVLDIFNLFRQAKGSKLLEECFREILGNDIPDDVFVSLINSAGYAIDTRVRYEKRYKTVKTLVTNGVSVHLFGADWNLTDVTDYPACNFYGQINCRAGRNIMEKSKILINTMPSYGMDAGSDRVFSAMLRGAMCITDATGYLKEIFTDGEEIVFYNPDNPSELADKVNFYLRNEDERLKIAKQGFEKVRKYHTYINRAEEILDIFEEFESNKHILK